MNTNEYKTSSRKGKQRDRKKKEKKKRKKEKERKVLLYKRLGLVVLEFFKSCSSRFLSILRQCFLQIWDDQSGGCWDIRRPRFSRDMAKEHCQFSPSITKKPNVSHWQFFKALIFLSSRVPIIDLSCIHIHLSAQIFTLDNLDSIPDCS